ncbi:hypothetical protein, partial [Microbacterium keratanolyticum]|uniref:hypothetical protein n=1 Tax=Microbacterium keratanolyticum TaxID=67574 RepID=UPI00363DC346
EGQWITTLGATGLPTIGLHHHPDGGRAALPAGTGGRIHGVLEIAYDDAGHVIEVHQISNPDKLTRMPS